MNLQRRMILRRKRKQRTKDYLERKKNERGNKVIESYDELHKRVREGKIKSWYQVDDKIIIN